MDTAELHASRKPGVSPQFLDVAVDIRTGSHADQRKHLGIDLGALKARPQPVGYRDPNNLSLYGPGVRARAGGDLPRQPRQRLS